ncbi:serine incorporator 1-like protein [Corchorus olitorius]|uniref:Serine incorporator 1-like protein n=1 Tax=Corchorus olitorius TaxID=93759 RepID=A0A1R3KER0_9ROSI|nr:serine incorporator 1-like protein [Corchorus olitorius]
MSFVVAVLAMVIAKFSTGIDSQCFQVNNAGSPGIIMNYDDLSKVVDEHSGDWIFKASSMNFKQDKARTSHSDSVLSFFITLFFPD